MTIDKCTISMAMRAMFHGEHEQVGGSEAWDSIYIQYIDLSGLANTKECTLLREMLSIDLRLSYISTMLEWFVKTYQFSLTVGQPNPGTFAFSDLHQYGHRLTWNGDWLNFEGQLKHVEGKEKKRIAIKDGLQKEYDRLKKDGMKSSNVNRDDRKQFIQLLNQIAKHNGYAIDRDKVSLEDFAIMVKDYTDYVEMQNNKD